MRLKDIHRGFAIVATKELNRNGENAKVSNIESTRELALHSKYSYEKCDRISYSIVNCNTKHDSLNEDTIIKYVIRFVTKKIKENHASDEFSLIDVKLRNCNATINYSGVMREEVANNIINSEELTINGTPIELRAVQNNSLMEDSRADTLEMTIMHTANELYKKKDKFGLGLSQKDLDEIIHDIDHSPVFKRLVEQAVRDWMKRQDDLNV